MRRWRRHSKASSDRSLVRAKTTYASGVTRFSEALEPNGLLIINLVPELKHVIGEQPPFPNSRRRKRSDVFSWSFAVSSAYSHDRNIRLLSSSMTCNGWMQPRSICSKIC